MAALTLNDNILVDSEKRHKLLIERRRKLLAYSSSRIHIEYINGMAARMYIDPYIKTGKASKLISKINTELRLLETLLKHFR